MNILDDLATGFFTAFFVFLSLVILAAWIEGKICAGMQQAQENMSEFEAGIQAGIQKKLGETDGPDDAQNKAAKKTDPKDRVEIR